MSDATLLVLVDQYRAGLDTEIALLARLEAVAARQREASDVRDLAALDAATDDRDRIMAALVAIEHELKPIRLTLLEQRAELEDDPAFQSVAALHRHAAQLVAAIVGTDQRALAALQHAEHARRSAARAVEQGEHTLTAYRRVVTPGLSRPTLVNRRG